MTRPSRVAAFFLGGAVLGVALAVVCWSLGWRDAFFGTGWLVGLSAAGSMLTWRDHV